MSRKNIYFIELMIGLGILILTSALSNNLWLGAIVAFISLPIIFSSWATSLLLGSSEKRVWRHFKRKPDFHVEWVQAVVNGQKTSLDELSPVEMVAVFSLLLCKFSLDEVVQKMNVLSTENPAGKFDEAFFQSLENTLKEFQIKGFSEERYLLLQLAQNLAQHHHQLVWAEKFHTSFMNIAKKQVEDQPIFQYK